MQRNALCRSRRELSNAYLLGTFGFDTAENEPSKVWPVRRRPTTRRTRRCASRCAAGRPLRVPDDRVKVGSHGLAATSSTPIGKISTKCSSFSAVSAPIFANTRFAAVFKIYKIIQLIFLRIDKKILLILQMLLKCC